MPTSQANVVQASTTRTGTLTGSDLDNPYGGACIVWLDVTATPNNAETLTLSVQGKDPASGKYQTIATFTALTASTLGATPSTETYAFTVDPVAPAAALSNKRQVVQARLPRTWRAVVTHSAGGSWTYSVGATVN